MSGHIKDIERISLGLQTERPIGAKQYALFLVGIKIEQLKTLFFSHVSRMDREWPEFCTLNMRRMYVVDVWQKL